jgi:hypothetical protein
MREWRLFAGAVLQHWGWLVSGVVITILTFAWGQVRHLFETEGPDVPTRAFYAIGLMLIFVAASLAWRDEHRAKCAAERQLEQAEQIQPHLVFDKARKVRVTFGDGQRKGDEAEAWQLWFINRPSAYAARKLDQSAARKVIHLTGGSFYALLI